MISPHFAGGAAEVGRGVVSFLMTDNTGTVLIPTRMTRNHYWPCKKLRPINNNSSKVHFSHTLSVAGAYVGFQMKSRRMFALCENHEFVKT